MELAQSSAISLPSLKKMKLDIGNVDVNSVDILLSGCPILETLELSFSPISLAKLRVPSTLKSLKLTVENDIGACVEIDAPISNTLASPELHLPMILRLGTCTT